MSAVVAKKATKPKKSAPVAAVATSLVLRVCREDFTSRNGFQWPSAVGATVTAPDWKANGQCGNGLHGWLFGAGDTDCVDYWREPGAKWLVLEVESSSIVMLGGKSKFPRAVIKHIGDRRSTSDYMLANESRATPANCIGSHLQVGDGEAAIVGSLGTATAGSLGTATAGDRGELRIRWYDTKADRYRTEIAYVGENGIKPNVAYRLDDKHQFVEVSP